MAKIDYDFFEKVIIQHCLNRNTSYLASIVDHIDKSIFKNVDIASVVQVIKDYYLENSELPNLTELKARFTTNALRDSLRKVVLSVKELDTDYNEDELIRNTELFIKQRKFDALIEVAIDQKTANKEVDLENAQKESEKIHSISLIDNLGLDYFEETDRVVEYLLQKDALISTGYRSLDEAFGGGFHREGKSIYNIGGMTNVGKSVFLANIALNVIMQDLNVVIISPEMSEMRYAKRISGMIANIAIKALGDNTEQYKDFIKGFKQKYTSRLVIKEFPTKTVSAKHIAGYLKRLQDKKGFNASLICIDGHALLKPSVTQPTKHSEVQYITQECRALGYTFNAPVLTVSQLNRTSYNSNNPGLDTLSSSWDSASDMDSMVNIWQTDEDREANLIRFSGKKVRDGEKGLEGFLNIDYDTLRLYEDDEYEPKTHVQEKNIAELIDFDSLLPPD